MFTVTVRKPRPDFRVFIDLLFGPGWNVDTDGDADPVWSRDWRELSTLHDDSVLRMALEGLIEIEDGILENSVVEEAARHVFARQAGEKIERAIQHVQFARFLRGSTRFELGASQCLPHPLA